MPLLQSLIFFILILMFLIFFLGKNLEIEFAVRDLIKTISSYKLEVHVEEVSEDDIAKLKKVCICSASVYRVWSDYLFCVNFQ